MSLGAFYLWGSGGPYDEDEFVERCPVHRVELSIFGVCTECVKEAEAVNEEDEE